MIYLYEVRNQLTQFVVVEIRTVVTSGKGWGIDWEEAQENLLEMSNLNMVLTP